MLLFNYSKWARCLTLSTHGSSLPSNSIGLYFSAFTFFFENIRHFVFDFGRATAVIEKMKTQQIYLETQTNDLTELSTATSNISTLLAKLLRSFCILYSHVRCFFARWSCQVLTKFQFQLLCLLWEIVWNWEILLSSHEVCS